MKKLFFVLGCLVLLAGCSRAVTPPVIHPQVTQLVKAVLSAGGREFELHFDAPEKNLAYQLTGDLILEFSSPVDLTSLVNNELLQYGDAEHKVLIATWPSWEHTIVPFTELKDTRGEPILWGGSKITITRIPFPTATLSIVGYPDTPLGGNVLAPGETVLIDFAGEIEQGFVLEQIRAGISAEYRQNNLLPIQKAVPEFTLEWVSNKALHLTFYDSLYWTVGFRAERLGLAAYFDMVPNQRIVVLNEKGEMLSHTDVPLSMYRAISMNADYSEARLVRNLYIDGGPLIGLEEYTVNLNNGKLTQPGQILAAHGWSERYAIYDWIVRNQKAYGQFESSLRGCGLSNNGRLVAVYDSAGEVRLWDLATGKLTSLRIPLKPQDDSFVAYPHWIYWSPDDTHIFYNALLPSSLEMSLYTLDVKTGQESVVVEGHYLLHASAFSQHLFTQSYLDVSVYALNIVDYGGQVCELSRSPEHVSLGKWIDTNRVILNKYSNTPSNWQCFIYYLNANRWEYLSEGYGFDYDANTGRVFLLQNR